MFVVRLPISLTSLLVYYYYYYYYYVVLLLLLSSSSVAAVTASALFCFLFHFGRMTCKNSILSDDNYGVGGVQDYLLMDPRVQAVDGDTMVNEMRQNIEIMLRKKKHAIQVRAGATVADAIHACYYRRRTADGTAGGRHGRRRDNGPDRYRIKNNSH